MIIETKCPECKKRLKWDVPHASTEIRYHTCPRGRGSAYVVKIKPAVEIKVKGQDALATVIEWLPRNC